MYRFLPHKLIKDDFVLTALTLNDFIVWSAGNLIAPIFAVFAIAQIDGVSTTEVGISTMIYMVTGALITVPIGKFLDKYNGLLDEVVALTASSVLRGMILVIFSFSTTVFQFYLFQFLLGITKAFNFTSWRVLFSKHLHPDKTASQWSIYDTIMSVGIGIASAIGGWLGDVWSMQGVIFVAGIVTIVGGLAPLLIYKRIHVEDQLKHYREGNGEKPNRRTN